MPVCDCVHVYMSCRSLAKAEHASLRSIPDIHASSARSAVREEAQKMQCLASARTADTNDASSSTWLDARQTTCDACVCSEVVARNLARRRQAPRRECCGWRPTQHSRLPAGSMMRGLVRSYTWQKEVISSQLQPLSVQAYHWRSRAP